MDNIRDKIKKLLALGSNNPNEHEAESALQMAAALMLRHGIAQSSLEDKPAGVEYSDKLTLQAWERIVAEAAGHLSNCRVVFWAGTNYVSFAGRPDNAAAALDLVPFLTRQVEREYKDALPTGLSKQHRAEWRRQFKSACAMRVRSRAYRVMHDLATNDTAAKAATGSTALVVSHHIEELRAEIDAFFKNEGVRSRRASPPRVRVTDATIRGADAGDRVKLRREIES